MGEEGRRAVRSMYSLEALAILAMLIFGTSFYALVVALRDIPPVTLGVLRSLLAVLFMSGLFLFERFVRGRRSHLTSRYMLFAGLKKRKHIILIFGTAFFGTALPNILQNIGMNMMDPSSASSLTSLIQGVAPMFTIILAAIWLHERLDRYKVMGLVFAIPATILLTTYSGSTVHLGSKETIGAALNLVTAMSYSMAGICLKSAMNRKADILSIIFLNAALGTIMQLPVLIGFWALGWEDPLMVLSVSAGPLLALFYLGVSIYAITGIIWYTVIQGSELSKATFFVFLLPLFSTVVGYVLLGERLSIIHLIAGIVLVGGVGISQLSKR